MKPVEIYSKEGCPYSRALKRKLDHDGITYVEYDVLKDQAKLYEMLLLNGDQWKVPTIVWPDKRVEIGFHGA
ncbi:MAG: glutaredoxin family protein [Anaerolineae bacterium]|jgi:glutaredoxin|nr:glutaredoxin family protein [Anaerolineae bacterium]